MTVSSFFGGAGRALQNPVYRRYMIGHTLAGVGRWMKRTSVGWLTWELTESTSWLGIVAFADLVPTMLFVILSGAIADAYGVRWVFPTMAGVLLCSLPVVRVFLWREPAWKRS